MKSKFIFPVIYLLIAAGCFIYLLLVELGTGVDNKLGVMVGVIYGVSAMAGGLSLIGIMKVRKHDSGKK